MTQPDTPPTGTSPPQAGPGGGRLARSFAVAARVFEAIGKIVLLISGTGIVAMTLIIGWHVFARRVLNDTPNWSETSTVLIMFWYSLLGAAIGVRYRMHIGLVFVRDRMPPTLRKVVDCFTHAVVAAVGVLLLCYGTEMAQSTWDQTIPTVGIPVGIQYLPFPIAGALIAIFAVELLLRTLSGQELEGAWN
ncbi:MAG: TRAP transporter small permease [Rhodospirillaceae bacterium]|nr:TRAP transporter small permease [Rhodospirillaceae bacterium]